MLHVRAQELGAPCRFNPASCFTSPSSTAQMPASKRPAHGLAASGNGLVLAVVRTTGISQVRGFACGASGACVAGAPAGAARSAVARPPASTRSQRGALRPALLCRVIFFSLCCSSPYLIPHLILS